VLQTDPDNQQALVILLLSLTDRFGKCYAVGITQAQEILPRLYDPYEKAYYAGIICERRVKAQLYRGGPGAAMDAYECLREAMAWYEKAEELRPPANDDALLRWNACARCLLNRDVADLAVREGNLQIFVQVRLLRTQVHNLLRTPLR